MFVCCSNKRQNGWTDRDNSHEREVNQILKISLNQISIFKIHEKNEKKQELKVRIKVGSKTL